MSTLLIRAHSLSSLQFIAVIPYTMGNISGKEFGSHCPLVTRFFANDQDFINTIG